MTEPDIFNGCESIDEILFLTFDHAGPEGLQELLAEVQLNQQEMIEAARSLQAAGLIDGAKIVRDAAARAIAQDQGASTKPSRD